MKHFNMYILLAIQMIMINSSYAATCSSPQTKTDVEHLNIVKNQIFIFQSRLMNDNDNFIQKELGQEGYENAFSIIERLCSCALIQKYHKKIVSFFYKHITRKKRDLYETFEAILEKESCYDAKVNWKTLTVYVDKNHYTVPADKECLQFCKDNKYLLDDLFTCFLGDNLINDLLDKINNDIAFYEYI